MDSGLGKFPKQLPRFTVELGAPGTTDDIRGFQQLSGVSFMTDTTVDGINGQAVWNWFKANKPNQSELRL